MEHIPTLNEEELRAVRSQTDRSFAKIKPSVLSEKETYLLEKINEGLPEEVHKRYTELTMKSLRKKISKKEHAELTILIDQFEAKTVERLKYLIKLAEVWQMTVEEVMKKLRIPPVTVLHV